jgi:hypothetical protein
LVAVLLVGVAFSGRRCRRKAGHWQGLHLSPKEIRRSTVGHGIAKVVRRRDAEEGKGFVDLDWNLARWSLLQLHNLDRQRGPQAARLPCSVSLASSRPPNMPSVTCSTAARMSPRPVLARSSCVQLANVLGDGLQLNLQWRQLFKRRLTQALHSHCLCLRR